MTPKTIIKGIRDDIKMKQDVDDEPKKKYTKKDLDKEIIRLERDMKLAAKNTRF